MRSLKTLISVVVATMLFVSVELRAQNQNQEEKETSLLTTFDEFLLYGGVTNGFNMPFKDRSVTFDYTPKLRAGIDFEKEIGKATGFFLDVSLTVQASTETKAFPAIQFDLRRDNFEMRFGYGVGYVGLLRPKPNSLGSQLEYASFGLIPVANLGGDIAYLSDKFKLTAGAYVTNGNQLHLEATVGSDQFANGKIRLVGWMNAHELTGGGSLKLNVGPIVTVITATDDDAGLMFEANIVPKAGISLFTDNTVSYEGVAYSEGGAFWFYETKFGDVLVGGSVFADYGKSMKTQVTAAVFLGYGISWGKTKKL